jgi:squalene-hopene/tetraprenyl-beta-curcumene cyclase
MKLRIIALFSALAAQGAFGIETPATAPTPAPAVAPKKPEFQYKSAGIEVPAASQDEPKVEAFGPATVKAAAKYLDDGAHHWVREKSCIACHSTGVYMVERSALTKQLGKPSEEVLNDFIKSVPKNDGKPGDSAIASVWRSSGLASWDKHVTGKLSEATEKSLRHTLSILPDGGLYPVIKLVEIPYITTRFELTVQAARAFVTAPGWLENLKDPAMLARIELMKKSLREHQPINDYELAMKLQLAALMPELVPDEVRAAAIAMLWRQQQPDGGWSTRRMADVMNWRQEIHPATDKQKWTGAMDPQVVALIQNEPDAANPGSDPYMTAFAIVLLRESGVPASDARLQRGIAWLKVNQRITGRWWMKSLFRGNYNYTTYISTAQALRALELCGELPTIASPSS